MNENRLIELIEEVLQSKSKKQLKTGEISLYCPVCRHYKKKLDININHLSDKFGKWKCWVCGDTNKTKGRTLYSLFRRFNASSQQISELKELTKDIKLNFVFIKNKLDEEILDLPHEYIPLWKNTNSIIKKHAFVYLKKRNIDWMKICRYQIGYAEQGLYKNRIIFPSFDSDGRLNYFIARSIFDNNYKYMNPSYTKNIIPFDLLINWKSTVILTEGVFDAIAVQNNAIPLFGKTLSQKLYDKILIKRPKIIMYLDDDAIKDSLSVSEKLMNSGIDVYIAIPPQGKDPGDLSFDENWRIIEKSEKINLKKIIEYKLKN